MKNNLINSVQQLLGNICRTIFMKNNLINSVQQLLGNIYRTIFMKNNLINSVQQLLGNIYRKIFMKNNLINSVQLWEPHTDISCNSAVHTIQWEFMSELQTVDAPRIDIFICLSVLEWQREVEKVGSKWGGRNSYKIEKPVWNKHHS